MLEKTLSTIEECRLIHFNTYTYQDILKLHDKTIFPFDIQRIYYLYEIPKDKDRGAHAHKKLYQLILAAAGSFTIELDDGNAKKQFFLHKASEGLIIVPGIWRNLIGFSADAVALILASEYYTEDDYIRNYNDFLKYRQNNV